MPTHEADVRRTAIGHFRKLGAYVWEAEDHVFGIQLHGCNAGDHDLAILDALRAELRVIGMGNTNVTDDGLRCLLDMPFLHNVDLTNTAVTDAGLRLLGSIKTLEFVHVEGTQVTHQGILMLQHALPNCEIVCDYELDA
jgi:hypothetical protein